jgi:nitrate/nitrite-specific signal transduction histidine kinase
MEGDHEGVIELRIGDDGCGFDLNGVPADRMGLGIMHERAQSVGATLEIESQPGSGTQILVVWREEGTPDD